jgi:hypothetical protein
MNYFAEASVGNGDGIFDAAYSFGDGGALSGTPEEIGAAVTQFLKELTLEDCKTMRYGTSKFYVQLILTPIED